MDDTIAPIMTPPTHDEIQSRLNNVRALMQREQLDYYVAAHTDNVYYLTNFAYIPFERPFFLIIPIDDLPILILPGLEVSHAEDRVLLEAEYRTYYEYPAPASQTYVDAVEATIPTGKRVGKEYGYQYRTRYLHTGNRRIAPFRHGPGNGCWLYFPDQGAGQA